MRKDIVIFVALAILFASVTTLFVWNNNLRSQLNEVQTTADRVDNRYRALMLAVQNQYYSLAKGDLDHQVTFGDQRPYTSADDSALGYRIGGNLTLGEDSSIVKLKDRKGNLIDSFDLRGIVKPGQTVEAWYTLEADPYWGNVPSSPLNKTPAYYWDHKTGLAISISSLDGSSIGGTVIK